MGFFFWLVWSVCAASASASDLSKDPYWLTLLHYRTDLVGRVRSEIDDPAFFLSPRGRTDPAAELQATVGAFGQPSVMDETDLQHPQCRFPARYRWLKSRLGWTPESMPEQPCGRYEAWREQMKPASASLIFASAYMNNPASVYGHTFLRLNRSREGAPQPLLDYTVNFAADVTTNNGILFALYGLTGGYRGRFSTVPYYLKVQEYNNLESRDLWEYDLALSSAAISRLVPHLWELGGGSMAYFFFNKNCSYQLLPLLQIADPAFEWGRRFRFKAIPADTLRAVVDAPGWVRGLKRRPSHVERMLLRRSRLSAGEIKLAEAWAAQPDRSPSPSRPEVLDSAYDLWRYRNGFRRDIPASEKIKESAILSRRNTYPSGTAEPVYTMAGVPPHEGHRSGQWRFGAGASRRGPFEELAWRPAVHDIDDDAAGYLPYSQLQMFATRLRFDNRREKLHLHQFTLVDLMTFSPRDRWVRHPSWHVRTGIDNAMDLNKDLDHSLYYGLTGGSGFSWSLPGGLRGIVYGKAEADLGVGETFRDTYRFGGGGEGGLLLRPIARAQLRFESHILYYPLGDPGEVVKLKAVAGYTITSRLQLRASIERQNRYQEALGSLAYYF